jgi:hypothetical protein
MLGAKSSVEWLGEEDANARDRSWQNIL